jgi:hypothetical protein
MRTLMTAITWSVVAFTIGIAIGTRVWRHRSSR